MMSKFLVVTTFITSTAVILGYYIYDVGFRQTAEPFRYQEPIQWGKSSNYDSAIKPFTVNISENQVKHFKDRLAMYEPEKVETLIDAADFEYGMPVEILNEIVEYWKNVYDWDSEQEKLNSLPQFTTVIHGIKLHFIHVKSQVLDESKIQRVPLLLVHGWPGSVIEFYDVVEILRQSTDGIAFDIVAPSIPGYTFSEAPVKKGFGAIAAAQMFNALMLRLGYQRYIYQGGDWGAVIGKIQARMFSSNVIGFHSNFMNSPVSNAVDLARFTLAVFAPEWMVDECDVDKISHEKWKWLAEEMGYLYEQSTKPDTIGIALQDSPVGLAAYILEKFAGWSENVEFKTGKGIPTKTILTNILLYWFSNGATTSMRFYKETLQSRKQIEVWVRKPYEIPTAVTCYPKEMLCSPKTLLSREMPKLVRYRNMPMGGHFAALEVPVHFAEDVRESVSEILKATA